MFPVPVAAYTFLLASQQIQYRFVCSQFLVICSDLITKKCCELNTALILLTLIFFVSLVFKHTMLLIKHVHAHLAVWNIITKYI